MAQVFILSLKVKAKPIKFNPLRARVPIWQPNDKPGKLLYLRKDKVM